ncbi:MAG: DUF202 domain-containing protein [Catenulispora sp.]|nr:DUF202 domain-containing protein [Catenulispora sp.]
MTRPDLPAAGDDREHRPPGAGAPWSELGEEPDYRFSLANERTFLAWIRTALALMAAAVGVAVLRPGSAPHVLTTAIGLIPAVLSVLICARAYPQWAAKQRAMRLNEPLPMPRQLRPLGLALSALGLSVVLLLLLR